MVYPSRTKQKNRVKRELMTISPIFPYKNRMVMTGIARKPFLIMVVCLGILSAGCNVRQIRPVNQDNGILHQARQAFMMGNHSAAEEQFNRLVKQAGDERDVNSGLYGISCLALATAGDTDAFLAALESILHQFPGSDPVHPANSQLLVRALEHGNRLMTKDRKQLISRINGLKTVNMQQNTENLELRKIVKNLEHQISILESIDQELQEKRKDQ